MKLLRPVAALAAALLVVAGCTGCTGSDAVSQGTGNTNFRYIGTTPRGTTIDAADRKAVGTVTGTLLGGGDWKLSDEAGKVVVLNFWASWCAPCRNEAPGFEATYQKFKPAVQVVGLDVKDPNIDSAKSFVSGFRLSYPIVRDENAETALELGKLPLSIGLPWTVIVDKDQRVAAVYSGQVLPADLEPVLTQLTAES